MMIQREDLVAAASLGILQYRQVDPLLIFLLQRDVRTRREAMLAQTRPARLRRAYPLLSHLVVMMAVVTAMLFAVLYIKRGVEPSGLGAQFLLALLYAACAIGVASWFKRRAFGMSMRILIAFVIAVVPVAVFALQHVIR